jgi:hypothetical protein
MIPIENRVTFILSELYKKLCKCDKTETDGRLNPAFHNDSCLYKIAIEKEENIKWTTEQTPEQTQES